MTKDELEQLRRRVEAKRRAQEAIDLQNELYGRNEPIDPDAVYVSVKEMVLESGRSIATIQNDIKQGFLKARLVSCGHGRRYVIHPEDAKKYIDAQKIPMTRG
jgi:hypothetical protein